MKTFRVMALSYVICFVVLSALMREATAATYYMATTGSDTAGDGSKSYPWKTLNHANGRLRPGDTLYVRGGSYYEEDINITASGTAANIITIMAYPGETPHFRPIGGSGWDFVIWYVARNYLTFDGFEVSGYTHAAFGVGYGTGITIRNCYIHDVAADYTGGIFTGYYGNTTNVIIENNILENVGDAAHAHAIYPSTYSSYITIRNNSIINCWGPAIFVSDAHHVSIYNNIVCSDSGNSRALISIQGSVSTDNEIYNNTLSIDTTGLPTPPAQAAYHINISYSAQASVKNNIFYGNYTAGYGYIRLYSGGTLTSVDNNLYWPNAKDSDDTGAGSFQANPLFVSPSAYDFRLQSSSPAIDRGTYISHVTDDFNGIPRPQGAVHDMGAFEYAVPVQNTDSSAPVVTALSVLSSSTSLTVPILTFTASDDRGVAGYMASESLASPSAASSGWSSTAPASFTFNSPGTKTLYAWAKDAAGNVSAGKSAVTSITPPDSSAPVVMAFSIPATSSSLTVPIPTFSATDDVGVAGYLVTESSAAPSAAYGGWSSAAPASFTFGSTGTKTLYAWAKDAAGNISAAKSASVSIVPSDTIPPTAPYGLTATLYGGWKVGLSWHASSDNIGVAGYLIYRNGVQVGKTGNTGYTDSIPGFETSYSYTVRAYDASGNVSQASNTATVGVQKYKGSSKLRFW